MAPVASVWRRAWTRSRGGGGDDGDADGGGHSLNPTGGNSTTSGTTYTASTTTATSDSVGEAQLPDFHASISMAPPTVPVVEENSEEELDVAKELKQDKAKRLQHLKGLVMELEFRGDYHGAVQSWLSELDVGWVVHFAGRNEESSGSGSTVVTSQMLQFLAESWILALRKIAESILTSQGQWRQWQDQGEGASKKPSASEFPELVQATVLKMLPFVDVAVAAKTTQSGEPLTVAPAEKLKMLVDMHDALSMASQHILSLLVESADGAMTMRHQLSAEMTKLGEAIRGTIAKIMNTILAWTWTGDGGSSSVIHKVTYSIAIYSKVLWANYRTMNRILHDAFLHGEFMSENENVSHVSNLTMEMVSSLERKTSAESSRASSPDQSLRLLFLINNSYYLLQELRTVSPLYISLLYPTHNLTHKIDDYIDSYLHVSWEPVLKCLEDPATPRCFTRYSSPLSKFELKFQKTYAAQKLWKVPDPEMRRRLRKAIIDKVIPMFKQFLDDNSINTPQITAMKVENMLGELFEG